MDNGCPWDGFRAPQIDFCERNMCSWVVEPGNATSSLVFVVVGLYLLWHARRYKTRGFLGLTGYFSMCIGFFSFAFHATMTYWGNFLDLTSMCVLAAVMVTVNLGRLYPSFREHQLKLYFSLVGLSVVVLLAWIKTGPWMFGALVAGAIILEIMLTLLARKHRFPIDFTHFWTTTIVFLSSFGIWLLDISGKACEPDNHWMQGHTVWHLGCALSVVTLYLYFRQFEDTKA